MFNTVDRMTVYCMSGMVTYSRVLYIKQFNALCKVTLTKSYFNFFRGVFMVMLQSLSIDWDGLGVLHKGLHSSG